MSSRIILFSLIAGFSVGVMAWSTFMKKNRMPVDGRTVLITGASQGMGLSVAKMLSAKGANIVIVARNKERLDQALDEISASALHPQTQRFKAIPADVTTLASNNALLTEAIKWNGGDPPDIIWAIAGASVPSLFLDADESTLRSQMDVNYFSSAYLAQAALRAWLASPHGVSARSPKDTQSKSDEERSRHFIMTSSVAAFLPLAGYAPYSPSKAALRSLHDQLKSELNLYNGAFSKQENPPPKIEPHIVFPGTITSPGLERENQTKHKATKLLEEGDDAQTPEQAAVGAIAGLEKGRAMVTTQGLMGEVLKACAWQGSVRDRPFLNTIMSWICAVVWLFVGPDMERKVWKLGEREGLPKHESLGK